MNEGIGVHPKILKNKKIIGTLKNDGVYFKKVVVVRAEQGVEARGWDRNEFWGVGVRWGVGWLKSTRGGVSLEPNKDG